MTILKVSSDSSPNSVAGAIIGKVREEGSVEIQSIGAAATNQAVKSVAVARSMLTPLGLDLVCSPSFVNIKIDNREKTAIRLSIELK